MLLIFNETSMSEFITWKYTLSVWDAILPPFYLLFILLYAYTVKLRKINRYNEYKFYISGLSIKIAGGLFFAFIYLFHYDGGDTTEYFRSSLSLLNLAKVDFGKYFSIMLGHLTPENASLFGPKIGDCPYYSDYQSYAVVRFSSIFVFLAGKSYITTTILIAAFTFSGLWSLFRLLYYQFPKNKATSAFAVLFIPSTLFWGSGILKDSYTLMGTCLLFVSFYKMSVLHKNIFKNILIMLFAAYLLLSIKPYIFFALAASFILVLIYMNITLIKNKVLRITVVPVSIIIVLIIGINLLLKTGETIGGQYSSLENMLKKASINQYDLKQAYYGGNSFDIGSFEPTIAGVASKIPKAVIAGLFRPYIWESKNMVMFISGLENSIFLFLSLYVVFLSFFTWRKYGFKYMRQVLLSDVFIVFSLSFCFIFSFFIGISTANFGALVRYKIPLIPFFMASLFIIVQNFNIEKEEKKTS